VLDLESATHDLLAACNDAGAFKQAVLDFGKGVAELTHLVESSKEALRKKEAERSARVELSETISTMKTGIDNVKKEVQSVLIGQFGDARGNEAMVALDQLLEEAEVVNNASAEEELQDWRKAVEKLSQKISNKVQELRALLKNVQQERKDAFSKRMGMFNKGKPDAKKEEIKLMTPQEFIKKEGMQEQTEPLLEISDNITQMRFDHSNRASVKRCLEHFVKYGYSEQASPPEGHTSPVGRINTTITGFF